MRESDFEKLIDAAQVALDKTKDCFLIELNNKINDKGRETENLLQCVRSLNRSVSEMYDLLEEDIEPIEIPF